MCSYLFVAESVVAESVSDDFEDHLFEEDEEAEEVVNDPFESFNRAVFDINTGLDKLIMKPLATVYKNVFPNFLQTGIENFTGNFFSPITAINFALQKDGQNVVRTVFRFAINTVFGFFGTVDVAAKMNLEKKETNLDETLKKWGARPGPYLVLPVFGPTSCRGGISKIASMQIEPVTKFSLRFSKRNARNRLYYSIYAMDLLAKRANMLAIMKELEMTSSDMYVTTRTAVMKSAK
jgi:phospholipid-binding lipoprotein MlaA